ncbi:MAG: FHA domain-containing protein [Gemmatimonadetes bacterium]|nr:FHA domain-containing protein [Gemmatimonadota bacterium]MBP6670197.1 FHA domain-containing protein [Gemmatimonadales bacterium]MBK6778571.1 FHA domain-containing protein [Gemmatimonadota bacterium]MBK7349120.1 FHA domain-containing protein [Gemmatimonadota bacterium]MBK7714684.1 FHA domain-containing protein [Gemmatimonadota bacterium]
MSPPAPEVSRGAAGGPGLKCPSCNAGVTADLPFCGQCGTRLTQARAAHACTRCGRLNEQGSKFCPACGAAFGSTGPQPLVPTPGNAKAPASVPQLALLDRGGQVAQRFALVNAVTTLGRQGADINFPDDDYLSPLHAQFLFLDGILTLRDLGSKNGTWLYLEEPHKLSDGDLILLGSQILRYRRLGYPGPRPPEQDATRRLGSLTPAADIANLAQVRGDGSARDLLTLSPGRSVRIGREQGDWQFPYDSSMSALHALIRSEDADFVLVDAGSRNGVAVAVKGERRVPPGARLLVGDQMLRAEIA